MIGHQTARGLLPGPPPFAKTIAVVLVALLAPALSLAAPQAAGPTPTAICPRGDGHPYLCMGGSEQGKPCSADRDCRDGGKCTRHGHLAQCPEQCLGNNPAYNCAGQHFPGFPLGGTPGDACGDRVVGYCSTESNRNFTASPSGILWGGFLAYDGVSRPPRLWLAESHGSLIKGWEGAALRQNDAPATLLLGQSNFYQQDWWRTGGDCSAINCNPVPYSFDQSGVYVSVGPKGEVWAGDPIWARHFAAPVPHINAMPDRILCHTPDGHVLSEAMTCTARQIAASSSGRIAVVDARSRVMIWNKPPDSDGQEADVVLGAPSPRTLPACNLGGLGKASLCEPVSAAFTLRGDLIVSDAGNHRVLLFHPCGQPNAGDFCNQQEAAAVLCQPDFASRAPGVGADKCNHPMEVATEGNALALADYGNNRVLLWDDPASDPLPSEVIGQPSIHENEPGSGANRFAGPVGVTLGGGDLYVSMGPPQYRILRFPYRPSAQQRHAAAIKALQPAALSVLGQPDLQTTYRGKVSNISGVFDAGSVAFYRGGVYVLADSNRVMFWANKFDASRGLPASFILGQDGGPNDRLPNRGGPISARGFDNPKSVAVGANGDLYVTDTANNRVLIFDDPTTHDDSADRVIGQGGKFDSGRANDGLRQPTDAVLNRPLGTQIDSEDTFWVADFANHRVLAFCNRAGALDGICTAENSADTRADLVLGQPSFSTYLASGCREPSAASICYPHDVFHDVARRRVFVLDGGPREESFPRLLVYTGDLTPTGKAASAVLGTTNMTSFPNCGEPKASTMCAAQSIVVHPGTGHVFVLEAPGMVEFDKLETGAEASRCFGMLDCRSRHTGSGYVTCAWSTSTGELGIDPTDNEIWVPGTGEDASGIMVVLDPDAPTVTATPTGAAAPTPAPTS